MELKALVIPRAWGIMEKHWCNVVDVISVSVGNRFAHNDRERMHFRKQGTWSRHHRRRDARRHEDSRRRQVNKLVGRARLSLCKIRNDRDTISLPFLSFIRRSSISREKKRLFIRETIRYIYTRPFLTVRRNVSFSNHFTPTISRITRVHRPRIRIRKKGKKFFLSVGKRNNNPFRNIIDLFESSARWGYAYRPDNTLLYRVAFELSICRGERIHPTHSRIDSNCSRIARRERERRNRRCILRSNSKCLGGDKYK